MTDIKSCFNCKLPIESKTNFCPNCGQKVDNNNLTLKALFTEFYENYLSFDTRMGRSIVPFLFQPGKLTKEFVDGKRVSFVNPFRFYLIISILFFSLLGLVIDKQINSAKSQLAEVDELNDADLSDSKKDTLNDSGSYNFLNDSITDLDSAEVRQRLDSILKAKGIDADVSITREVDGSSKPDKLVRMNNSGLGFNINLNKMKLIKEYRYDPKYTNEQLLDSLQTDSLSDFERHMALQSIKLYRSDAKVITRFVLGNLSIAMFILIPSLALILLILYYRKRLPFVVHIIHSLQLHTFSFFIYSIGFLLFYYFSESKVLWISFILSAVYMFFSFKRVYEKRFWGSFFRVTISGVLYYFVWALTLALGLIISFLLF